MACHNGKKRLVGENAGTNPRHKLSCGVDDVATLSSRDGQRRTDELTGTVEVDETFVGSEEHGGKRGRGADKDIVVIAVEMKEGQGFGRTRMRPIPDASGASLLPFIRDSISPDATLVTDAWKGLWRIFQPAWVYLE